ncbi:MAG: hydrogenase formation protein HypD [Endomicrobiia bacterium]
MDIISQFKDKFIVQQEIKKIICLSEKISKVVNIMEVCGTHTMQISRYGLRKILPQNINLISGPGCPVCVTPKSYLDKAIFLVRKYNVVIVTFGDMVRVPGSESSLEIEKSRGEQIEVVYSPMEVIEMSKKFFDREIVFLSIGFETTMPSICVLLKELKRLNIKNVTLLVGNKFFLPAMETLLKTKSREKDFSIDGLLLPGHLSSIVGEKVYFGIAKKYNVSGVITGFEPVDIVRGIRLLMELVVNSTPLVLNEYTRVVTYNGNTVAQKLIRETFDTKEGFWRGIGNIANSESKLKKKYSDFDTEKRYKIPKQISTEEKGCRCAEVILGKIKPFNCPMFAKRCSPENPVGACMVSSEGSCAAYYKYER